jgi:hypothetical protein
MPPSKWLVFIRPDLAGFDRPLTKRAEAKTESPITWTKTVGGKLHIKMIKKIGLL